MIEKPDTLEVPDRVRRQIRQMEAALHLAALDYLERTGVHPDDRESAARVMTKDWIERVK